MVVEKNDEDELDKEEKDVLREIRKQSDVVVSIMKKKFKFIRCLIRHYKFCHRHLRGGSHGKTAEGKTHKSN